MVTVLIGVLAFAALFGICSYVTNDYETGCARVGFAVLTSVVGMVIGLLAGGFVAGIIGATEPTHQVVVERDKLVSLNDATGLHGSFFGVFFLASGSVDSTKYIYYVQATPKGYQFHSMQEEDPNVYIVQEARTDGELDVIQTQFVSSSEGTWGLPIFLGQEDHVFHIPSGSITTCFTLNSAGASGGTSGTTGCPAGS